MRRKYRHQWRSVIGACVFLLLRRKAMGNFSQKIDKFIEIFIDQNGYTRVVEGLQNTLLIAVCGLIIGILIGTVIATVRVLPKYKVLPRVLNGICSFMWRCSVVRPWWYSSLYFIMSSCRSSAGISPAYRCRCLCLD